MHLLQPLDDTDSTTLLFNHIPHADRSSLDPKVLQSLLKVCGGNPSGLSVAAGLLATKGSVLSKRPEMLETAISMVNPDCLLQGVRKVLYICYADLPLHVKSCFLYLSAFPKRCTISKHRLIRRWIAEGFIPTRTDEETLWEAGERCFNELASRRLIQMVFDDGVDDRPVGCTLNDVIHDFIMDLSSEENMVTLAEDMKPPSRPRAQVRRLSLDTDTFASTTVYMSNVRSLTLFGNTKKPKMPNFSSFKLLRVLDLEDIEMLGYKQLKSIGRLSLLRYLGLRGTGVSKLPKEIIKLKHLDTLDLRRTMVTQLPKFKSAKLVSLRVDRLHLQRRIGEMQYLEELSMVNVTSHISPTELHGHGSDSLAGLAQLVSKSKKMRRLAARFDNLFGCAETYRQVGLINFLDEVAKSDIRSLSLHEYPSNLVDLLVDRWSCTKPRHLQKFELRIAGHLSKIPQKQIASLVYLTHLHIKVFFFLT